MGTEEHFKNERNKIVRGLKETYVRLIEFKKLKKSPMIIMKDGKIVAMDPYEMDFRAYADPKNASDDITPVNNNA